MPAAIAHRAACERCQAIAPGNPELVGMQSQVTAALVPVIEVQGPADFGIEPPPQVEPPPAAEISPEAAAPALEAAAPAKADVLGAFVSDLEQSLGTDFAVGGTTPASAEPAAPPPAPPQAAPAMEAAPGKLAEEVHEEASSVLSDMFAEFKEDAEAGASEVEDPDTHYNLGVAFREMGLLDEAIGELQKVCHAIDRGHPFSQPVQAYTWLAQCLVDKGAPEAAVRWYQKALTLPGMDSGSRCSVYYDLASAFEASGDKKSALANFMEVYGSNIDFRDVASRIKALKA